MRKRADLKHKKKNIKNIKKQKKNIKSIKQGQQAQANGLSTTQAKDGDQFSADNWVVSLPKRLKECVENQARR